MPPLLERIPQPVLSAIESNIQKVNEELCADVRAQESRLHGLYGDYDDRPLEDEISMLHLERLKRAFTIEAETWLRALIQYAPEQIDQLGRWLLQRMPDCAELKPKDLDELKRFRQRAWQDELVRFATAAR